MGDAHFPDFSPHTTRQSIVSMTGFHDRKRSVITAIIEPKLCVLCRQQFDSSDYPDHVAQCNSKENNSSPPSVSSIQRDLIDTEFINDLPSNCRLTTDDEADSDMRFATPRGNSPIMIDPIEDDALDSQSTHESKLENHSLLHKSDSATTGSFENVSHMDFNDEGENKNSIILIDPFEIDFNHPVEPQNQRKYCILCNESVPESDFEEHMLFCSSESPPSPSIPDKLQTDSIDTEYTQRSSPPMVDEEDFTTNSCTTKKPMKECILCFTPIAESEYESHVYACLNNSEVNESFSNESSANGNGHKRSNTSTSSPKTVKKSMTTFYNSEIEPTDNSTSFFKPIKPFDYEENLVVCFACQQIINPEDNLTREIACPSRHIYCLSCLQHSMAEFARNRLTPVCHPARCDYELSRHDISLIPLERRISDRLLPLVKGQQRPQCQKCRFYININENDDYYEHIESCGDFIPCEYCLCPYSIEQIENHTSKCRTDKTSQNEKLTNFILTRTKYPFTKEQIYLFIQEKKKDNNADLDPFSIVAALAVFGSIFPLDMPTRVCDVCIEARPYDDIYVFGCLDCHKLCYSCYYQSCETKMSNGEILTCGLCPNPLEDGELNQLRIPGDQLQKIRDYQIKKTFDVYSSRTRGIIKCPNQKCTWICEAEDPNERFKVSCPLCNREFCSLCNQQYHYRTTCQQLPEITQRWFFWCQTERTRYITMRAQQDAHYAARLQDYNRQKNENENRNRDLRRRYEELMTDEQYKTQNCRLCPSCKRVVQRLEGCDKMVCGQDADGGNVQSGCGHKFRWAQAQPYTGTATSQPKQTINDLPKPDNPILQHTNFKCDECQQDIYGIRFDCVHCPSLSFCERCEQQSTLQHSAENQRLKQQQHVFRLIMAPNEG